MPNTRNLILIGLICKLLEASLITPSIPTLNEQIGSTKFFLKRVCQWFNVFYANL